jgi:large conductance mechanosensitive channel
VGVIIGAAFGKLVSSLVNDIFMPLIGLILGGTNLSGAFYALDGQKYASAADAAAAGVGTLNYGLFLQTVIDFLLMALCVFLFVKLVAKLTAKRKPRSRSAPRLCPSASRRSTRRPPAAACTSYYQKKTLSFF